MPAATPHKDTETIDVAIIGAGPAGLMAAETLAAVGIKAVLFDAMPTPARKFLMAGKSGLNITHSEAPAAFLSRYGAAEEYLTPAIEGFTPADVCTWADDLGAETFAGSSGRVFPKAMKASPLLRAWLARLSALGVTLRTRHRWQGWDSAGTLLFVGPKGDTTIQARATILALGGASWPKLGSDGSWTAPLTEKGVEVTPLQAANCGFDCDWSEHFKGRFAGEPVKNVALSAGGRRVKGDFVISQYGIEGSAVYTLSATLRDLLGDMPSDSETVTLTLDLTPDRSLEKLTASLLKPRGKKTFATHLKRMTGLSGVKAGLLRECVPAKILENPTKLAAALKALRLPVKAARPVAEAISTAGGVSFGAVDESLMLSALPGTFCAGEMLDWEAPTGGYLITGCMAQGKQAAEGVIEWLKDK